MTTIVRLLICFLQELKKCSILAIKFSYYLALKPLQCNINIKTKGEINGAGTDTDSRKFSDFRHSVKTNLQTVGKSDNSFDTGLVGVHDCHLGDGTSSHGTFKEGLSMGHFHWNLTNTCN